MLYKPCGIGFNTKSNEVINLTGDKTNLVCKNIFSSQNENELRQAFLKKWVEVINYLETAQ